MVYKNDKINLIIMIKKKILIDKFEYKSNELSIIDKYKDNYFLEVKNGNVETEIINSDNVEVGIKYLEKNDFIKIYGIVSESNKFIIKKILINTKYQFNSESSEDLEIY